MDFVRNCQTRINTKPSFFYFLSDFDRSQVNPNGKIPVVSEQTNVPHIYAIGDCTSVDVLFDDAHWANPELTPVAVQVIHSYILQWGVFEDLCFSQVFHCESSLAWTLRQQLFAVACCGRVFFGHCVYKMVLRLGLIPLLVVHVVVFTFSSWQRFFSPWSQAKILTDKLESIEKTKESKKDTWDMTGATKMCDPFALPVPLKTTRWIS